MKIDNLQSRKTHRAGFTVIELVIASTIIAVAGVAFVSVMNFSGYAMLGITQQSEFNNMASNTTIQIIQRTRYSHTFEVSGEGTTLTLSFDDDSEVDSDDDGDFYNDTDHTEIFKYAEGAITHQSAADATPHAIVTGARLLNDAEIFTITPSKPRQIDINFELYNKLNNNGRTQRIDISTSAYRVNGSS